MTEKPSDDIFSDNDMRNLVLNQIMSLGIEDILIQSRTVIGIDSDNSIHLGLRQKTSRIDRKVSAFGMAHDAEFLIWKFIHHVLQKLSCVDLSSDRFIAGKIEIFFPAENRIIGSSENDRCSPILNKNIQSTELGALFFREFKTEICHKTVCVSFSSEHGHG